jgi:hypothetical protein
MIEDMEELHASQADRQELHALVDHIPAGDLPAARKILRAGRSGLAVDPLRAAR